MQNSTSTFPIELDSGLPTRLGCFAITFPSRPGGPDATCFQPALSLVAAYLEANHFKPFLASSLYNNYVKELIAMIQATPPSHSSMQTSLSATRTESDTRSSCSSTCSSERLPRSTSNTLLASSSGLRASTSFDCGELQDPDSIWRRRPVKNKVIVLLVLKKYCYCCKQVGRVNSFGRYQPGLDLAPQMSRTEVIHPIFLIQSVHLPKIFCTIVNNYFFFPTSITSNFHFFNSFHFIVIPLLCCCQSTVPCFYSHSSHGESRRDGRGITHYPNVLKSHFQNSQSDNYKFAMIISNMIQNC